MASPYCSITFFVLCVCIPPLWCSGQSSRPQIQKSGFDSRLYQIFWEVVGLERGPLSLVSTIEELLERKSIGSSLEIREYCHRDLSHWLRDTLYLQKLALTSPTSSCHLVGIICLWTQATEFVLCVRACVHALKESAECVTLLYTNESIE
jgi:hypothetical protein